MSFSVNMQISLMCHWIISLAGQMCLEGKLYDYHPALPPDKEEMRRFLEMCFEPGTPANMKLKESLFKIMEDKEE